MKENGKVEWPGKFKVNQYSSRYRREAWNRSAALRLPRSDGKNSVSTSLLTSFTLNIEINFERSWRKITAAQS